MPKMRLGWYAGASTALAGLVVVSAFQQRPNFYSAMVYLAQSNFCLIILINFSLLLYSSFMYGLTRICFGRLRAIEVEVLTERAWFAITETCLAMTIFRDEIGAWFLVMFTGLVTGKVWGWIGEGRVEILEQQPPANPRLFHTRLSASLAMSFIYDILILRYTIRAVIQQARPNMMVMFLFEFAVLTTTSWRTALRYFLSIAEQKIVQAQTKKRLQERRQEVREQREAMIRERARAAAAGEENGGNQESLPDENDIEEMDIEVPGWAAKGEWVLWLDLVTDMLKLAIYVAFFFMLLFFYGLPIHIIRDLFLTTRDFFKRLRALLRYRKAIQEMNRFPDATEEDLARENTCIICREEMRPWDPVNNPGAVDRVRPKKLPCGHILHLGCLKSWLERQQVCPTCRSPVTGTSNPAQQNRGGALRIQLGGFGGPAQNQAPPPNNGGNNEHNNAQDQAQGQGPRQPQQAGQQQRNGPRIFNLGPFRLGLADNQQDFNQLLRGGDVPNGVNNAQPPATSNQPLAQQPTQGDELATASTLLEQSIQAVNREYNSLSSTMQQIQTVQLLLAELHRLRQQQQRQQGDQSQPQVMPIPQQTAALPHLQHASMIGSQPALAGRDPLSIPPHLAFPHVPMMPFPGQPPRMNSPILGSRHGPTGYSIPSGSSDLPEGLIIPPGWSLMPLQRLEGGGQVTSQMPTQVSSQTPGQATPQRLAQIWTGEMPMPTPGTQPPGLNNTGTPGGTRQPASDSASSETAPASESSSTRPVEFTHRVQSQERAPVPVPNWSGSAQLFSQPSQVEATTVETSVPQPVPESRSATQPNQQGSSSSDAGSSSEDDSSEEEQPATQNKGKARAVTVEEASSEDDSDE